MNQKKGKVWLVGAGPGSVDLITVRGLKIIQKADVILYDALVNKELLKEATETCALIYVGKRAGKHKYSQEGIHKLLVEASAKYKNVVRLKGGDPFVFGRGHEELVHLQEVGIEVEVVPGISSATSLPLLQSVPLTRRGVADSFWVITGTTTEKKLSGDIYKAVETDTTLVILMGIRKIPQIAELLLTSGKGNIPMMIIQNGSRQDEKVLITDAENVVDDVRKSKIGSPGIIVIGSVVSLHPAFTENKIKALCRA